MGGGAGGGKSRTLQKNLCFCRKLQGNLTEGSSPFGPTSKAEE